MAVSKDNMYSYLDQLSTQELETLLQNDAETPDGGDPDMVMYILEVIEKREGGISAVEKETAAHALEEFFAVYGTSEGEGCQLYPCDTPDGAALELVAHKEHQSKFSVRRVILVAAVLICAFSLVACSTVGIERFFQMAGKWTAEIFNFENQYTGDMPEKGKTEISVPAEDVRYNRIEDALAAYGITEKVVPTKLPEDFTVEVVEVIPFERDAFVNFYTLYQDSEHYLLLQIRQITDLHTESFEKDKDTVATYTCEGILHYFYTNEDSNCVTWFNGNLECVIDTDMPEDDLRAVIDSIYER